MKSNWSEHQRVAIPHYTTWLTPQFSTSSKGFVGNPKYLDLSKIGNPDPSNEWKNHIIEMVTSMGFSRGIK